MSTNKTIRFTGQYAIDDGYVGGDRTQYFSIDASELDDEMTDDELINFYEETAEDCFRQSIGITTRRRDEFVAWARAALNSREKDEQ